MVASPEQRGLAALGGGLGTVALLACALVVGLGVAGAAYGSAELAAGTLTVASAYLVLAALGRTGPASTAGVLLSAVVLGAAVAGANYGAAPLLLLGVPLAVGWLVLAVTRPVAAVSSSLLLAVAEAVQVPLGGLGAVSATEVAFLVLAAGWTWRAVSGDPTVRYPQIADYPLVVLVLAVLPGLVLGVPPPVVLRLIVLYTAFFLTFLTVKAFSPQQLRAVLTALAVGGGLLSAAAIIDYVLGGGVVTSGSDVVGRAAYGIPDPNYFGAYVLVAATPALALLVERRALARAVTGTAVALCGVALVLSFSRGALLGAGLALTVVLLSWSRSRALSVTALLVLLLTTAANLNPLVNSATTEVVADRLTSVGRGSSTDSRLLLWDRSIEYAQQNPQGTGTLDFKDLSLSAGITERGRPLENAHNAYLNVLVELGWLGLAAYLLWHARVAWDVTVELRRRRPQTRGIAVGVAAAFAGFSLQALTIVQYRVQTILATMFVLTGVAAAARAWPDEVPDPAQRSAAPGTRTPSPPSGT